MTTFRRSVVFATGAGLVALVLGSTNAVQVAAETMKPLLVLVQNTQANPVPVLDVGAAKAVPFQIELCLSLNGGSCQGLERFFDVPETTAGGTVRRLVIEYASGTAPPGLAVLEPQLLTSAGGELVRHHVVPFVHPSGWTNFAHQTRIYADAGTQVRISGTFDGTGGYFMTISGRLELE